jgi:selenocysteine-specific elongation factor
LSSLSSFEAVESFGRKEATLLSMKPVIVGTAGHIDHGKTTLVKALTGIDADRLEEEKRRGITIDLGFANLELTSDSGEKLRLGFVDVPGHERFVRNMLAGIGGIDIVLLVIAADEGIKPQTREHFDICRLLAVPRGIVVLTKADTVDAETLEVVRLEIEDFLRGSFLDPQRTPIVPTSAITGSGIGELKRELARIASEAGSKSSSALPRLPIDRAFVMKGFGTVVTGTLVAGTIHREQELILQPAGKRVRARGIQVHGAATEQAHAGERTAVNLAGVTTEELARGMMLSQPGTLEPTRQIDVRLQLLAGTRPLRHLSRVHLHCFASETVAQVRLLEGKQIEPGDSMLAQLRPAEPLLVIPGDRFIIRQFSPVVTIGGGMVLDAFPLRRSAKHNERAREFLTRLEQASPIEAVALRVGRRGIEGLWRDAAVKEMGHPRTGIDKDSETLLNSGRLLATGDLLLDKGAALGAAKTLLAELETFHKANPLVAGIAKETLREKLDLDETVFSFLLTQLGVGKKIQVQGEQVRLAGRGVTMSAEEERARKSIEQAFSAAGLKVPLLKDVLASLSIDRTRSQKIVTLLLRDGVLVKLGDELVFHRSALEQLRKLMATEKTKAPKIDVGRFKDLIGVTRKHAIPLLEYLDRERVTRRVGDLREIL